MNNISKLIIDFKFFIRSKLLRKDPPDIVLMKLESWRLQRRAKYLEEDNDVLRKMAFGSRKLNVNELENIKYILFQEKFCKIIVCYIQDVFWMIAIRQSNSGGATSRIYCPPVSNSHLGQTSFQVKEDHYSLTEILVSAKYRCKGVGSKLFSTTLDYLRLEEHVKEVRANFATGEDYIDKFRHFFEKHGFKFDINQNGTVHACKSMPAGPDFDTLRETNFV